MTKLTSLEDFRSYIALEKRLSPNTVEAYLSDLHFWGLAGLDLEGGEPPSIPALQKALLNFAAKDFEEATLARRSSALRVYAKFRSLGDIRWLEFLAATPSGRLAKVFPKALEVEDIEKLLDFEPHSARELRNRALLEVLYAGGLRVSELLELSWPQVRFREGLLRVLGKGKKERLVPITERALEWLERYQKEAWAPWAEGTPRRVSEKVFLSHLRRPLTRMAVWKILHARALTCGVDNVHPHVFRHSYATHLLQGGADIRFVQAMLGHESLNTTERYLKMADDELVKMFNEHHPLR